MGLNQDKHVEAEIASNRRSVTLTVLRQAHPAWFDRKTCRLFGDVNYRVLVGKVTKTPYLVRLTAQWSDMFGGSKRYRYRLNPIRREDLKILPLVEKEFDELEDVREWLMEH